MSVCGKMLVYGAGGHAKVVIDAIEKQGEFEIAFVIDDNPGLAGKGFCGYQIVGGKEVLADAAKSAEVRCGIVAVGDNIARLKLGSWLEERGLAAVACVHPSAQLGRGVIIGGGSVLMAGTIVNSDSVIGQHVVINTGASIDHDCSIGGGVHIAPGSTLCGAVSIGAATLVGAGVTIIPNISVGSGVVIGAGTTVVKDVPDGVLLVGDEIRPLVTG